MIVRELLGDDKYIELIWEATAVLIDYSYIVEKVDQRNLLYL